MRLSGSKIMSKSIWYEENRPEPRFKNKVLVKNQLYHGFNINPIGEIITYDFHPMGGYRYLIKFSNNVKGFFYEKDLEAVEDDSTI